MAACKEVLDLTNTCSLDFSVMAGRGSWERVDAARRHVRLALGKDPAGRGPLFAAEREALGTADRAVGFDADRARPQHRCPVHRRGATRLGMSRAELEAMIGRGQVETLTIEFGRVVPTTEVERLIAQREQSR